MNRKELKMNRNKLKKGIDRAPRFVSLQELLSSVCRAAGITEEEICGRSRKALPAAARHVFCYHAAQNGFGRTETARMINRNYSTAVCSIKSFGDLRGHYPIMDRINDRVGVPEGRDSMGE
jgi:hypothetical protein